MSKIKGAGTLVWARETPVVDLTIGQSPEFTSSAAANSAFLAAGYQLVDCVFGLDGPGYSYATIEDEVCLGDTNNVAGYSDTEGYQIGDIVSVGKNCYGRHRNEHRRYG